MSHFKPMEDTVAAAPSGMTAHWTPSACASTRMFVVPVFNSLTMLPSPIRAIGKSGYMYRAFKLLSVWSMRPPRAPAEAASLSLLQRRLSMRRCATIAP